MSTQAQKAIMKAAKYDQMKYMTSIEVFKLDTGRWDTASDTNRNMYATSTVTVTKNYSGPSFAWNHEAGLVGVKTNSIEERPIAQVNVGVAKAKAGTSISGSHAEANAGVSLIGGSVSAFDFNLGAGVSTGGGIKDDSLNAKFLGTGITVGRKVGISVFDNEISIDFGKLFGGW